MKCSCYTYEGTPCKKDAKYKMILRYNNEPIYCCSTHAKKYFDKTKSFYYSVKRESIEEL